MSRCFSFPPPGYELKPRSDDVDLLAKELKEKSSWRNRWQDQLAELKRRSTYKDSEENLSWGARMRRMSESSTEQDG